MERLGIEDRRLLSPIYTIQPYTEAHRRISGGPKPNCALPARLGSRLKRLRVMRGDNNHITSHTSHESDV
eukprot:scaffold22258_cov89-Cyclotella_meneghiniana.AAC.2